MFYDNMDGMVQQDSEIDLTVEFETLNQASKELIETLLIEYIAVLTDDDKLQEKSIKKAYKIEEHIKASFDVKKMKELLDHDAKPVQLWAAKLLLPYYEEISLKVLDDISRGKLPHLSSNARIIYCEWKKEPITFPY